jgi:hypothetical protein
MTAPRHRLALAAVVAATALVCPAGAAASFSTGVAGNEFLSGSAAERAAWLDRAVDADVRIIRLNVSWRGVTAGKPADPADPADPAYNLSGLDAAIRDVTSHGLEPLLTINSAPDFAQGRGRPGGAAQGSWKPDPSAVEAFGHAIAARYSGSFEGLPRVRYLQLWNEPNLSLYLSPAYEGKRLVSAPLYRRMLDAFYAGVKAAQQDDVVVTGGTAPYGDDPGGKRVRPLAFWRSVLCVKRSGHRYVRAKGCGAKAQFDVLAHHPIDTAGGPTVSAINRDDVSTPDVGALRRLLRAAERLHTVGGPRRHPIWATEIWWESNPPDRTSGVPLATQARYIEQALYLLWKQGVSVVVNLEIADPEFDRRHPDRTVEAGLFFHDGRPKPALQAFGFPFVADRRSRGEVRVWGKAPVAGEVIVERRKGGGWKRVKELRVGAGSVFSSDVRQRGPARLRAVVAGETSLTWNLH